MTKPISNNGTKEYLGDGVYGQFEKFSSSIILTTEDGISVHNQIYMGANEVESFIRYAAKHFNLKPLLEKVCEQAEDREQAGKKPTNWCSETL